MVKQMKISLDVRSVPKKGRAVVGTSWVPAWVQQPLQVGEYSCQGKFEAKLSIGELFWENLGRALVPT